VQQQKIHIKPPIKTVIFWDINIFYCNLLFFKILDRPPTFLYLLFYGYEKLKYANNLHPFEIPSHNCEQPFVFLENQLKFTDNL